MTCSNRILHHDEGKREENFFTWSTMPAALTENCASRTLTRDLFAVANFLGISSSFITPEGSKIVQIKHTKLQNITYK